MSGMMLRNRKQQEQFSAAIGGTSGTKGNKGGKLKQSKKPEKEDETSQSSTAPTPDEEQAACLAKQNLIKQAWPKCNNIIYHGLGKMTTGAYEAALKDISWESKFLNAGKKMEVS